MKNRFNVLLSVVALCCVYGVNVPVTLAWDPLTDAGANLVAWYDASDGATVLTSGTTITNWLDKSSNGYDLDNGADKRYFNGLPHINGLTAVEYTYVGYIQRTGMPDVDLANGVCLISVGKAYGGDTHHYGSTSSTNGSSSIYFYESGSGTMNAFVKVNGLGNNFTFTSSSYIDGVPFMCAVYYDPAGMAYLRGNGGANTASSARDAGATFTINAIKNGRLGNTASHYHGEMIVLNTADIAMIEKVEGYLAHKWGLYSSLPPDHPYRYAEPGEQIRFGALSVSNITTTSAELYVVAETNLTSATLVWDTSDKGKTNVLDWAGSNSSVSGVGAAPGMINATATGLTADTEYFFRFYGENATTNGWSIPGSFSTPFSGGQGPIFTNATPLTPSSIQLLWLNGTTNETGFVLQRTTNEISGYITIDSAIAAGTTTYTDSGLDPDTKYYYQLAATNSSNGSSTTFSLCQTNVTTYRLSTITFDKQSGTGGDDSVIAALGSPMPGAAAPARSGYGFAGYFTLADGQGTQYYNPDMSSAIDWDKATDETLFAYWNAVPVVDAGAPQAVYLRFRGDWSPDAIPLTAWYDASDSNTIHLTGGGVSRWDDKSSNSNNATQSDAGKMPTTDVRQIGGLNALNFDATEDFDVPSFNFIGKECWTVINKDTADDFHVLGSSGNVQVGVISTGKMRIWPAFSFDTQSTGLVSVGSDYLLGFRALNPKKFSLNGAQQVTGDVPNNTLTINHIMENQYAHNSDGLIGEIVVTASGLGEADREKIEGYLAWKWSLKANLPAEHPYAGTEHPQFTEGTSTLAPTVNDSDSTPTYLWTDTGTGTGRGVYFADPTVLNPDVTFTDAGTYILQLSVDDGISIVTDTVTITVSPTPAGTIFIIK